MIKMCYRDYIRLWPSVMVNMIVMVPYMIPHFSVEYI